MQNNWDNFMNAYANATDDVKHIIDSEVIADFLDTALPALQIDENQKPQYISLVADVALSLTPIADVPDTLLTFGLSSDTASKMTLEIKKFIESQKLTAGNTPASVTTAAGVKSPKSPVQTAGIPAETQNPTVQPLRTMEADVDKVHGYGAYRKMHPDAEIKSAIPDVTPAPAPAAAAPEEPVVMGTPQAEVLQKSATLAATPTYTEPDSPKQ